MKNPIHPSHLLALLLAVAPSTLRAQIVNDGATNTLSNVTNSFASVTVGTNGSFTLLVLANNSLLTNSLNGVIGLNATARSNEVRLTSPSARWLLGNDLFVGNDGSFSRLVVSNGATVNDHNGYLGPNGPSSNNFALVTGAGSVWSNGNVFYLGFNGAGNQLVVSNGGVLRARASNAGVNSSSSNNFAMVTGTGSQWSNAFEIQFGIGGPGNQLVISNGGAVWSSLGTFGAGVSASNTVVLVTDSGSLWNIMTDLYVGQNAVGNQLLVRNGGAVRNGHGYIGANFTGSNNLALVTGAGSTWSNAIDLDIGAFSANNRLIVSNSATVFVATNGIIGPTVNGNANSATVTDPGSQWVMGRDLFVGSNSAFNRLVVSNAGTATCQGVEIGFANGTASNNLALVTGPGSLWSSVQLVIGRFGHDNQLNIADGGRVDSNIGILGANLPASNCTVSVSGPGSTLNLQTEFSVGGGSVGNRLAISNGAAVRDANGYIGFAMNCSNNQAIVTGSGSVWSNATSIFIGNSGSRNQLVVSNGGAVFAERESYLGFFTAANSNTVIVVDTGTRWQLSSNLYVGSGGALNRLVISNGALVANVRGTLGQNISGSNNFAVVTGFGTAWNNSGDLTVGDFGSANRLVVSNGASVENLAGFIGLRSASSNNQVSVIGPGTIWRCIQDVNVGEAGKANRLTVGDGGQVISSLGIVGGDFGSIDNLATVSGAGSSWTNESDLYVGLFDGRNTLVVSNGGVVSAESLVVGREPTSLSNRISVADGTLRVRNVAGTGLLNLIRGTNVFNGGLMDVDQLLMTNSASRFEFNSGLLITRGAVISNNTTFIMGATATNPAVWDVRAGTIDHRLSGSLFAGYSSSFNQLLITNGALLTNSGDAYVGLLAGSRSNTVLVAGTGSRWLIGSFLYVGYSDRFNRLLVTNGGFVSAANSIVGGESAGTNCEAIISGPGSVFSNAPTGVLQIGSSGISNRVQIENGGLLLGTVEVGRTPGSAGNLLSVTGPGSRVQMLSNLQPLTIGYDGSASRLDVSDGGAVIGFNSRIGFHVSSSNNVARVTGPGSVWSNLSEFQIGDQGSGNRLEISAGGTLLDDVGYFGINMCSNNEALVTGSGSAWTNFHELYVGLNGSANQLVVSNAGTVFTPSGYVGYNDGALSNTVIVTDPGSRWLSASNLIVGSAGAFNRLLVKNGASVVDGFGTIGATPGADFNLALLTDPGSVWSNQLDLVVGESAGLNQLIVSTGAQVISSNGVIGDLIFAGNNRVLVTGAGSAWINAKDLWVGNIGQGNGLVVSNGGTVIAMGEGVIGNNSIGRSNMVVVSDPGSRWVVGANLVVGGNSASNLLLIANGGQVISSNGNGIFGLAPGSTSNRAVVTGPGSLWSNCFDLYVGYSGPGNQLTVSDGGVVRNGSGLVGVFSTSTNNLVVVTGPGALWSSADLFVGFGSANNQLVVSNAGTVVSRNNAVIGLDDNSTNSRVLIDGGTLRVTNDFTLAHLDVRRGTNVFNAGLIEVDRLFVTSALGFFEFNGGRLISSSTTISNGLGFNVGDGVGASIATFELRGGSHSFVNGLTIASDASLVGSGSVAGILTAQPGSMIAPGLSIGTLTLSNSPTLRGTVVMEIGKNGATLNNDQIQVVAPLTYGGSLVVSNLGPTALASGNRFPLFIASSYSGGFTNITLPPLPSPLVWTNKLTVDGSIEVAPNVPLVGLTIQNSNGVLLVSWPTNGSDYCLESSDDLLPPVLWHRVSSGITTNGASFVFTLPSFAVAPKQFFRLAFPCSPVPLALSLQLSNNLVTVSWSSNEFRLETTYNLAPPVAWQTISNGIGDTSSLRTFTFTNDPAVTNQFFRLAFP